MNFPGDIATIPAYELNRLTWLWGTVVYPASRDMLAALPAPIYVPHLPAEVSGNELANAARRLARARTKIGDDIPEDVAVLARRALDNTIGAATLLRFYTERSQTWHRQVSTETAIREACARTRAVTAYLGVEPEEAGAPDTLTEATI